MSGTIRSQNAQASANSQETVYPQPTSCDPKVLTAELNAPSSVTAGSGATFTATVTNGGEAPCLLDAGSGSLGVVIVSGSATVWTSDACPSGAVERMLLISPGDSTTVRLAWNGRSATGSCAVAAPSTATAEVTATATADSTPAAGSSTSPSDGASASATAASDGGANGPVATAGTYRVRLTLGGEYLTSDQVMLIQ